VVLVVFQVRACNLTVGTARKIAASEFQFLWRVVNLFLKVRVLARRERERTRLKVREPAFAVVISAPQPVVIPVVLWVFVRQIRTQKDCPRFYCLLILTRQVLWRGDLS